MKSKSVYLLNIKRHHSRFNSKHHDRNMLCDHLENNMISTLTSYNFLITTPIQMKLEKTICMTHHNCEPYYILESIRPLFSTTFECKLLKWDNFQSNPMVKIICGVGKCPQEATYLCGVALEADQWFPPDPAIDSQFRSAWKTQVPLLTRM